MHKQLGPGYPVDIYRTALCHALDEENIAYKRDHAFTVECAGKAVGEVSADLYVGDRFLLNVMAEHVEIDGQDRSELRARLRAADLELGLIINFGERRLKDGLVRVLNPDKLRELQEEMAGDEDDDDEYEDDDEEYEDDDEEDDDEYEDDDEEEEEDDD